MTQLLVEAASAEPAVPDRIMRRFWWSEIAVARWPM
jgi:hypothetical protein